jgi:hypothetical protein
MTDEASEKCLVCAKRIGGDLDTKSSLATTQHKDTKSFCVSDVGMQNPSGGYSTGRTERE